MKTGDLVWYYPAHGLKRRLCVIYRPHDIHGLLFNLWDINKGYQFIASISCIKLLDKPE